MGASDSEEVPSEMKSRTRSRISTKDFSFFSFDDNALEKMGVEVLVVVFPFTDAEAMPSPAPLADIQPPAPPTSAFISLLMCSLEEEAFGGRIRIRGFFFFFFFLILFWARSEEEDDDDNDDVDKEDEVEEEDLSNNGCALRFFEVN